MTGDESRKAEVLSAVKSLFPGFGAGSEDLIERAIEHDNYADTFPEDMIEERLGWLEIRDMFNDVRSAFNLLANLIVREAERRDEDD